MLVSDPPIIVEQTIAASASQIWSALTALDEMHKWYFDILPAFEAKVGFETAFEMTNGGRTFPHKWKVTEVIPESKLIVQWTFDGYPGSSNVIFELIPQGDKQLVRLTAYATEDHPQDIPEFRRESGLGGWNYFIKERLKGYFK